MKLSLSIIVVLALLILSAAANAGETRLSNKHTAGWYSPRATTVSFQKLNKPVKRYPIRNYCMSPSTRPQVAFKAPVASLRPGSLSQIALSAAESHSTKLCLTYVRKAVQKYKGLADVADTESAKDWGPILENKYGARKLPIRDPDDAPNEAIIVYTGGKHGHVEIKTQAGYVSDFVSTRHSKRRVTGIYQL